MLDNFENLQKKCKKYQLKKNIKLYLPILTGIFFVTTLIVLSKNSTPTKKTPPTIIKSQKVQNLQEKKIPQVPKKKEQIIEDVPYALQIDKKYQAKQQTYEVKPTYKKEVVPQEIQRVYIKREKPKALAITVKKLDSVDDMILYYNKEKKYSLALKIAQTYYNSKEYSNSLLWSKKANLLNRDADGAWILYAKSEYAIGHHKRAIKILSLYITNADSNEAKALLLTWTQGK